MDNSAVINAYIRRIQRGEITFEEVPSSVKEEVALVVGEDNGLPTESQLLKAMLSTIVIPEKPTEKNGFITTWVYDPSTHSVVWEFIKDENYLPENDGSDYLKPKRYVEGMTVVSGLWYTDGDNIWEAIKNGVPFGFDDFEYFDIII